MVKGKHFIGLSPSQTPATWRHRFPQPSDLAIQGYSLIVPGGEQSQDQQEGSGEGSDRVGRRAGVRFDGGPVGVARDV